MPWITARCGQIGFQVLFTGVKAMLKWLQSLLSALSGPPGTDSRSGSNNPYLAPQAEDHEQLVILLVDCSTSVGRVGMELSQGINNFLRAHGQSRNKSLA